MAPSFPRVSVVPAPENTAPNKTQIEQIMAAVRHDTIFVPTAVPKTLAASLAPRAQPRKRPLDKNTNTRGSIAIKTVFLWHRLLICQPHLLRDRQSSQFGQQIL